MTVLAAVDRTDVAHFLSALVTVYSLLIFGYVLLSLVFSFGVRVPYSRASDAVLPPGSCTGTWWYGIPAASTASR